MQIAWGVDPDKLDQAIDALQVAAALICPASLREAVARKCDLLKTEAVFCAGCLWLIDVHTELAAARFDYLDDKATLIVRDTLKVDPAIDPRVLSDRLDKVHSLSTPSSAAGSRWAPSRRAWD